MQPIKLRFLGTGISQGVPVIGCRCPACHSHDPLDTRLRTAALIQGNGTTIAIDIGPDFRQQMLAARIDTIHALLITHEHSDHVAGLDDIRPFNWTLPGPMPIHAEPRVMRALQARFPYAFMPPEKRYPGAPELEPKTISDPNAPFTIRSLTVEPLRVMHGELPILGYRIGPIAYITDCSHLPDESISRIRGIDLLVINALRHTHHPMHLTLSQALTLIERISPKSAYLTHISHEMGTTQEIIPKLPPRVHLAHDGLQILI